jgi:hypothetical protein
MDSASRCMLAPSAATRSSLIRRATKGVPLGGERSGGKILIEMRETAPSVEVRPLAAYESVAMGGAS